MVVNSYMLVFRTMKRFLFQIILFFAIVAVIDIAFGAICDYLYRNSKGGDTHKIHYAIGESEAQVLVMGSSRASHHYNPEILSDSLGLTVYNLGIDGSGAILMDGLYNLITKRYSPQLIIYELTPAFDIYKYVGDANDTRYLSQLKPYHNEDCISHIFDDVEPLERFKLNSGLYRYNTQFINLFRFYFRPEHQRLDGYRPHHGVMTSRPKKRSEGIRKNIPEIDSLKLFYLQQLIKDCELNGTTLLFSISPSYGAKSINEFKPVLQICRDNGCAVFNHYMDSIFINDERLFKDSYHLNEGGANIYTSLIASEVKKWLAKNNDQFNTYEIHTYPR